jgi:hypothetical protein
MCPSSGETTVFIRHLVLVILTQVDSLKLQGRMPFYDKCRIKTVVSPDDGHIVARNMYRLINILRNKRTKKNSAPS